MTSFVKAVTWDCGDALRLATFWAAALGSDVDEESTQERAYVEAAGWGGPNMWFIRVPEGKAAKNRLHFDLRPVGRRMDDEVERLSELGATVAERFESHVVMRDPEGNEFCVEPGGADS
jgi:Glyoxalase-like domain